MQKHHGCKLRKGRVSTPGQTYLLTTVTHQRQALFSDFYTGRIVVDTLRYIQQAQKAEFICYVIMPDHLHCLISLGDECSLSQVMSLMKGFSAHRINKRLDRINVPVWQRGFHDHAIRKEEDIRNISRYIIANPMRAGLVAHAGDYPLWDAKWL